VCILSEYCAWSGLSLAGTEIPESTFSEPLIGIVPSVFHTTHKSTADATQRRSASLLQMAEFLAVTWMREPPILANTNVGDVGSVGVTVWRVNMLRAYLI